MAYGQRPANSNGNSSYGNKAPASNGNGAAKTYEKDPSEVGIAYMKSSDKGGTYFSVVITADIPAGSKVMIFENKTKNRSEKTPTHILKLAKQQ